MSTRFEDRRKHGLLVRPDARPDRSPIRRRAAWQGTARLYAGLVGLLVLVGGFAVLWPHAPVEWQVWLARTLAEWRPEPAETPETGLTIGVEDGIEFAATIHAQGWPCRAVTRMQRLPISPDGTQTVRIECGDTGPSYRLTVRSDGGADLQPW